MKCEGIHRLERLYEEDSWVPFLDVEVTPTLSAAGDGFSLSYRPYRKPTSLWIPLSHTSLHSPAIHLAWPSSMVRRLSQHCSNGIFYDVALADFVREFRLRAPFHPWSHDSRYACGRRTVSSQRSFLVLPYSSTWREASIDSILHDFNTYFVQKELPLMGVSWSLAGSHAGKFLKAVTMARL